MALVSATILLVEDRVLKEAILHTMTATLVFFPQTAHPLVISQIATAYTAYDRGDPLVEIMTDSPWPSSLEYDIETLTPAPSYIVGRMQPNECKTMKLETVTNAPRCIRHSVPSPKIMLIRSLQANVKPGMDSRTFHMGKVTLFLRSALLPTNTSTDSDQTPLTRRPAGSNVPVVKREERQDSFLDAPKFIRVYQKVILSNKTILLVSSRTNSSTSET